MDGPYLENTGNSPDMGPVPAPPHSSVPHGGPQPQLGHHLFLTWAHVPGGEESVSEKV
jgi:hypothetical protein